MSAALNPYARIHPYGTRVPIFAVVFDELAPLTGQQCRVSDLFSSLGPMPHLQQVLEVADSLHSAVQGARPVFVASHPQLTDNNRGLFNVAPFKDTDLATIDLREGCDEWVIMHELAHWLDNCVLSDSQHAFASQHGAHLAQWRAAVERSDAYGMWQAAIDDREVGAARRYLLYLIQAPELFARSYTQWLIRHAGRPEWNEQIHGFDQRLELLGVDLPGCWSDDDFDPIHDTLDQLFNSSLPALR